MFHQKVSIMTNFFLGLLLLMNTLINVHAYDQDEVFVLNGGRKVLIGQKAPRKLEEISRAFGRNINNNIGEISKISGEASSDGNSDHFEGKMDFNGKPLGDIHHKMNSSGDHDFVAFNADYNGTETKASKSLGKAQESLGSQETLVNIDHNIETDHRKLHEAAKEIASLMHKDYTFPIRRAPPINNHEPYH